MGLLIRLVTLAIAFWVTTLVVPGISIEGGVLSYLWIAAIFGLINLSVGKIVRVVALPFVLLTLGLGLIVINALMLMLTAFLTDALTVDGFLSALLGSLLIAVVSFLLGRVNSSRRS
jgi:putative membrane protein